MKNGGARDLLNFKPQEKEDTDDQEKEPPEVQYKTIVRNAVNDYLYLEKYVKELKHGEEPLMHNKEEFIVMPLPPHDDPFNYFKAEIPIRTSQHF